MGKLIDLTGRSFNRLTVVGIDYRNRHGQIMWKCSCSCGSDKSVAGWDLRSGQVGSCGCYNQDCRSARRGPAHPSWRGGRSVDSNGYIRLRVRDGDSVSRLPEHRVVMAGHLGRPLAEGEEVHHRNGVRDDNRIENLELKVSPHGSKITVDDAIAWAKDILVRYDTPEYYAEEELCL